MKFSSAAVAAATVCLLADTVLSRPTTSTRQIGTTPSIEVTFNGGRPHSAAFQSVGVMWPIDGQFYTPQQVAADFPAAQFVGGGQPKRVHNAGQSVSTEDIVSDGTTRVRCSFAGLDGTTHIVDKEFPGAVADVAVKPLTIGAPTAFTSGECHYAD